jgi:hypothetical protein
MFEILLLMSIVLAVISQLLPEAESAQEDEPPSRQPGTSAKKSTVPIYRHLHRRQDDIKKQPCRNICDRAA